MNTTFLIILLRFLPGPSNTTSFEDLEKLASELVNQVQTGGLDDSLNVSLQSFALTEPVPEPVDPTGGVRATNETGWNSSYIFLPSFLTLIE